MSLRTLFSLCALVGLCVFLLAQEQAVSAAEGPTLMSGGPLTFGPDNVLFIADNSGAKIVALELGDQISGGTPGTVPKEIHRSQYSNAFLLIGINGKTDNKNAENGERRRFQRNLVASKQE